MPRLMSVAYTEAAVLDRTKTVTRRLGWRHAEPGQRVVLCRKVMGRKAGEPLHRLVVVQFEDVRRERLDLMLTERTYGLAECDREGFPELNPESFLHTYFTKAQGVELDTEVTRIRWSYLEDACLVCGLTMDEAPTCTHVVAVERL